MSIKHILILPIVVMLFAASSYISIFAKTIDPTLVSGHVYDTNGHPAKNILVTVACTYKGQTHTLQDLTNSKGKYLVTFVKNGDNGSLCDEGATVTSIATINGITNSNTGVLHNNKQNIDVSVINIFVPEYGLTTGILATIMSLGLFLIIRRKISYRVNPRE